MTDKDQCKRNARKIKGDFPDKTYMQRLDIAAKQMGYKHYKDLTTR